MTPTYFRLVPVQVRRIHVGGTFLPAFRTPHVRRLMPAANRTMRVNVGVVAELVRSSFCVFDREATVARFSRDVVMESLWQ